MSLKQNIIANYASQIYVTVVSIIMVPLYIKYMGVEAYGLVGFFAMLQVWFNLLDMGLTATISRESARYNGGAISALEYRRLARALAGLFWLIGLVGAILLFALAEPIAVHWLNANNLSTNETIASMRLIAIVVVLRWISGFYRGVITGAERLVWLGGFNSVAATCRFVLVLPILMFINNSPLMYFAFQLLVGVFELLWLAIKADQLLPEIPADQDIRWEWAPIKPVLRFAMTIAVTSSIWVFVTQIDKLVLSKILSLADFGYFSMAVLLASGIMIVSGPISSALMPNMARLQAEERHEELIVLYRQATRLVTMVAVPTTLLLTFFASNVLWVWTGNVEIMSKAAPVLTLYAAGYGFLALGAFPYYLQYAKGDLKLHLIGNILFIVALIPCVIWATNRYGVTGAGWAWLASNVAYFFFWVPLVHRRFEPQLHWKWILTDIVPIALPAFAFAALAAYKVTWSQQRVILAVELTLLFTFLFSLCFILKMRLNFK